MPTSLEVVDDYFALQEEDKMRQQITNLSEKVQRLAKRLPMHELIHSQAVKPELRWQKTSNWRNPDQVQESEQLEVVFEDVGKLLISCVFITASEVKSDIMKNQ